MHFDSLYNKTHHSKYLHRAKHFMADSTQCGNWSAKTGKTETSSNPTSHIQLLQTLLPFQFLYALYTFITISKLVEHFPQNMSMEHYQNCNSPPPPRHTHNIHTHLPLKFQTRYYFQAHIIIQLIIKRCQALDLAQLPWSDKKCFVKL